MLNKTCFVIMPIGDQEFNGAKVTADDLKQRYDDLIKEAIQKADPSLEVVRADEVSAPGSITTDILTRIIQSYFVVADITYPNPNVFYELGLRHACRVGTVIIREKNGPTPPFDIVHLRHIEYENTPTGLKALSDKLKQFFLYLERTLEKPDNQFLEVAKLIGYSYPRYGKEEYTKEDAQIELITTVIQSPEILDLFRRESSGEKVDPSEQLKILASNPQTASTLIKALVKSGSISTSEPKRIEGNPKGKRQPKKKS
jgi:hypothetical protein